MGISIQHIEFKNFKVLRDAALPLGRFNLLIGPNGSGKSTVVKALRMASALSTLPPHTSVVSRGAENSPVSVVVSTTGSTLGALRAEMKWLPGASNGTMGFGGAAGGVHWQNVADELRPLLGGARAYALDADLIASPVQLNPSLEITSAGANLAVILDQMRDSEPERFEALNAEIGRLLPEFDRVLFDTLAQGQRLFALRTKVGGYKIAADDLSQGTLFAVAIITLAYLPLPPPIVCFEEPDRGIHPRLLREIRDAIYRLSHPENYGEKREPTQVIATTHSPYMVDLYRDHPEEIVIAEKGPDGASFERLSDRPDLDDILADAHLGEVWYSGILGGVPASR